MSKRTVLIAVVIVAAVAGFLFLTRPAEEAAGTPTNHQYSQGSSGIVLIEYGDFQCTACGGYYPIVKQIKDLYKDTVTFQFRHLPLESLHVNARAAARAAEAAAKQGKFWEMHDQLFETQRSWGEVGDPLGVFSGYAEALGLNVEQFKTDYVSAGVNASINADLAEFDKTNEPKSTPTFFLDGKKFDPDGTFEGFTKVINEALQAKGITPPQAAAEQTVPATDATPTTEQPPTSD